MSRVAFPRGLRSLVTAVALGLFSAFALGAAERASVAAPGSPALARSLEGRVTPLRLNRLAQAAIEWRGGPIVTSTGETVTVFVSDAFASEVVTPESWAEFLAGLVHGSELSALETRIAPLSEVRQICGARALGCYSRNRAISIGETLPDGTTAEEVIRHEYGHHIALYRSNEPWRAIEWGPKRWASAANICARVTHKEAFPGDQGSNYTRNPGEAWAEVYRLMDERKAGVATGTWQTVAPTFYPDDAALEAAEQDVIAPWTAGEKLVVRRNLTRKGQVWWIPVSTPLDGSLSITVTVPRGGLHEAALVAANRRTVLQRTQWSGVRQRSVSRSVCGQRSLYVKVTQKGTFGGVTVAVSRP
ncbi:MAG: hypothetical protein H0U82_01045 [Actinobacteria bacterium]|nr:hypothetical protein [Actinomycetota bacterium]